jgi:sugar phosphate isomerase/epimerase
MLLGAADYFSGDWLGLDAHVVGEVAALGFSTMNLRIHDPLAVHDDDVERTRRLFADHGLVVGQTVGEYGGTLVSPDGTVRGAAIEFVKRMCDLTRRLGAPNTYLRPGSLNPAGAWLPHRDNRSDAVFDRLVDSTRRICETAEANGTMVAVEAGVVSPLHSPARVRAFLEAVDSPALGFNQDPVNLVGSLDDAYDTTRLIDESFDLLGAWTIGAHAKDVRVVDGLLPRFEEAEIGDGLLDHVTFLRRMQSAAPDAHVLIEHLPADRFPAARRALMAFAAEAGVHWDRPAAALVGDRASAGPRT